MDKEDEHSPSEFYYSEDLQTFDVETETGMHHRKPGGHRRFYQPTEKCKHNKKTATDMNTLLRYIEAKWYEN